MKKFVQLSAALALSTLLFVAASASGQAPAEGLAPIGPKATHQCATMVLPGKTLVVNATFTFDGLLRGLSWSPVLPPGWTVISVNGTGNPLLSGPQGPILWQSPPYYSHPISFSYTVQLPADAAIGTYQIRGLVAYTLGDPPAGPKQAVALPDPLVVQVTVAWTLWWQHSYGTPALWSMVGTQPDVVSCLNCGHVDPKWRMASAADINHDGRTELRWQHEDGWLATWFMNGTNHIGVAYLNPNRIDPGWRMVGSADIDQNGQADILWQNTNGTVAVWFMNGTNRVGTGQLVPNNTDPQWKLVGAGHFKGNTQIDLLWQRTDGSLAVWFMDGLHRVGAARLTPGQVDPSWKIVGTYDLNGDGHTEIIWQNTNGRIAYWVMEGMTRTAVGSLSSNSVDPNWHIVGPR